MGAQTVGQISDYYSENYFLSDDIEDYARVPEGIKAVDKEAIVKLACEFASSGIHGFVAVGSCERQLILDMAERLRV